MGYSLRNKSISRKTKPLYPVEIDRGNRFGQHVLRAFIGAGKPYDLVAGPYSRVGSPIFEHGNCSFSSSENYLEERVFLDKLPDEFSLMMRFNPNSLTNRGVFSNREGANWGADEGISFNTRSDNKVGFFLVGSTGFAPGTSNLATGEFSEIACQHKAGEVLRMIVNGTTYNHSSAPTTTAIGSYPFRVGSYYTAGSANTFDGIIDYIFLLDKKLSEDEAKSFFNSPWQVLKPRKRFFIVPTVATGAYTLTADSGSYSVTGADAGLKADRQLAADSGSYAITGTNATLAAGRAILADSGTYSMAGTGIGFSYGKTLSLVSGAYTFTGTNAALVKSSKIALDSGGYVFAGADVTFNYSGASAWTIQANSSDTWTAQTDSSDTWTLQ